MLVSLAFLLTASACSSAERSNGFDSSETDLESPLYSFLGWQSDQVSAEQQKLLDQQESERQLLVSECMTEKGFDYTPPDVPAESSTTGDEVEVYPGTREYVEKYGFGVSTVEFPQSAVGPNLVGHDDDDFLASEPNEEYVRSLDPDTLAAYNDAYFGAEPDITGENMSQQDIDQAESSGEPNGCRDVGLTLVDPALQREFDNSVRPLLDELSERILTDGRVQEELERIKQCVTEAGSPFLSELSSSPDDSPYGYFIEKVEPIRSELFAQSDDSGADQSQANVPATLTEPQKALLSEVQAEEVSVALKHEDCGAGIADGVPFVVRRVQVEMEQQFLDDNSELLAPFEGMGQ